MIRTEKHFQATDTLKRLKKMSPPPCYTHPSSLQCTVGAHDSSGFDPGRSRLSPPGGRCLRPASGEASKPPFRNFRLPCFRNFFNRIAKGLLCLFLVLTFPIPGRALDAGTSPAVSLKESNLHENDASRDKDVPELLVLANQAYLDGNFTAAAKGYETLLARGHANGHLFYNLGNCYIRLGRIGRAILNYKKARILLPRDGDLKANLQYARSLCKDRIEESQASIGRTLAFWYFGMSFRGILLAFCLLNGLFWLSLLLRLYRDSEWVRWCIALSLLVSLLLGVSAVVKYRETFHNKGGVILTAEAPVRAGFSHKDTVLFILHEGTEFKVIGQEKGWWKIELPDGKKGWIPQDSGERVLLGFVPKPPSS